MTKTWIAFFSCLVALALPKALLAQAVPNTPQAGYLLVLGKSTDRAKIGAYAASLPPIYAANNGRYFGLGAPGRGVTWLEGPWLDRSLILAQFPSRTQIDSFWWGPAYREAIKKRDNAGVFSVFAFSGQGNLNIDGAQASFLVVMTAPRDATSSQASLTRTAAEALQAGVMLSGGIMLSGESVGSITALEGDTPFTNIQVAMWPDNSARAAFFRSPQAKYSSKLRRKLGLSVVASLDGIAAAPKTATQSQR